MHMLARFIHDDSGSIVTIDWLILATALVIGSAVAAIALRDVVRGELEGFGKAVKVNVAPAPKEKPVEVERVVVPDVVD